MRKQMIICILLFAGGAILLTGGCGVSRHQPEPVTYYALYYTPPDPLPAVHNRTEKPLVIHLPRLHAQPPYNTTHMVYADSPYQRNRYAYHQWVSTPAEMLTSLLLRDIETSKIVDAAVSMPAGKGVTHRIEGVIIDFYENDEKTQWEAVLVLRMTLTRMDPAATTGKILLQRTYNEVIPLKKNNPHELARSMSKAMEAVSRRFIADIYGKLP